MTVPTGRPRGRHPLESMADVTGRDRLAIAVVSLQSNRRAVLDRIVLRGKGPESCASAARAVGRSIEAVQRDLEYLRAAGLIRRDIRRMYAPAGKWANHLLRRVPSLAPARSCLRPEVGCRVLGAARHLVAVGEWPSVAQVASHAGCGNQRAWEWIGRLQAAGLFPDTAGLSRWDGARAALEMRAAAEGKRAAVPAAPKCNKAFIPRVYRSHAMGIAGGPA